MRKTLLTLTLAATILACGKKENPFLIEKGKVGLLTKNTPISELETIYVNDSLVKTTDKSNLLTADQERYVVFDKQAKHLLTLTPTKLNDSTEVIENIRIVDSRYKTAKGITVNSTFKDINSNYTISKIVNSLFNVLVFVDEIDAYFVIDKKELPEDLRYSTAATIEAFQIPETAKIKYFMIGWQ